MQIELTDFVRRQWKPTFSGTKMNGVNDEKFLELINMCYGISQSKQPNLITKMEDHKSWEFCKYLFFSNGGTLPIKKSTIKLDHTIAPFVQCDYSSRTPTELKDLGRWVSFPAQSNFRAPVAEWVGVVLYSREQLLAEWNKNPQENPFELSEDCEYGIVAIMGLGLPVMDPMTPITHMRNALGQEYGGNGQPIDLEEYNRSVEFWRENILIK